MTILIAEIGQNHNGDIELAKDLISAAKSNGADIAKFQFYDAKSLFSASGNPWYEYNIKTELSYNHIQVLFDYCKRVGIEFMVSSFDVERLQYVDSLGVGRHKIASRSINDLKLVNTALATGKEVYISLGYWKSNNFPTFSEPGEPKFLYCISKYPTEPKDLEFNSISFDLYQGFSDHTVGIDITKVAFARGAKVIEKHFTLDHKMFGPDHSCSMTPDELAELDRFRKLIAASIR